MSQKGWGNDRANFNLVCNVSGLVFWSRLHPAKLQKIYSGRCKMGQLSDLKKALAFVSKNVSDGDQVVIRYKGKVSIIDITENGAGISGPIKDQIGG